MEELRALYCSLAQAEDCPKEISTECKDQLARFQDELVSIQHDVQMQRTRVEALLRLLSDRRTLVSIGLWLMIMRLTYYE